MITEESYKRGKFLVREGEICDKMYYIKKGATRSYIKHNKQEITTYISVENEFETSVSSFFSGKPSRENIEVLEPCQLEVLYKKDLHFLYEKFSETNVIVRIILEEYYQAAEERAYMARVGTAVEKYQYLIDTRGHFLNRIPLKHLASFLSMRLETLSRLRTKHYRNRTENKFSESVDSDTDH